MNKNIITNDELNQFRHISLKNKIDSMQLYLIGKNGYKFNMQDVGYKVFSDPNYSYTVSLIHRCYNFSGQNSGKYRDGCKFEQRYGYRVSRKDIEAFIKKYPNGTFNSNITFEDFLITRINNNSYSVNTSSHLEEDFLTKRTNNNSYAKLQRQLNSNHQKQDNYTSSNSEDEFDPQQLKWFALLTFLTGATALIFMFIKGTLFDNWIISILIFLCTYGSLSLLKK